MLMIFLGNMVLARATKYTRAIRSTTMNVVSQKDTIPWSALTRLVTVGKEVTSTLVVKNSARTGATQK